MDDTMTFGLLMESAQAHQKLAEGQLLQLRAHTQDLDGVVRDEIRRTLTDELKLLSGETERAAQALRKMRRMTTLRTALCSLGLGLCCALIPVGVARWVLPSQAELAALGARRSELNLELERLRQLGGRIDLKHCGSAARLCVRIDGGAPRYGTHADYYVVDGY